jgi:hypothetical protein
MVTIKNSSNFNLKEFSACPKNENNKILAVKPEKVYLP